MDLEKLYENEEEILKFNERWKEFFASDSTNEYVFKRKKNLIIYPHKSWIPEITNEKPSILILGGNPAPHSVWKDIYYAYEGKGIEHRFWRVLRELGFIDLYGKDPEIKSKFLNLEYSAPFRFGFEAMFSFPSPASTKKWSGVMGLEKLFKKKYFLKMYDFEKMRVKETINSFFKDQSGFILAMQKDAYNAVSLNKYDLKLAVEGKRVSEFNDIKIYGTPPTRWLHTKKMKNVLRQIKERRY